MDSSKGYKYRCCVSTSSRVAFLQYQLQDLSERECRARNYNRKLLQKFQRAQNTLSELVARTEAMNSIRMEYNRFLEQNYPEWQQKLQDKSLSEKGKRIGRGSKHSIRNNTTSAISLDPSYCPHVHSLQHMADRSTNVAEVNMSNYYGDISESSDLSSNVVKSLLTEVQLKKINRTEKKKTHNIRKDAVSQESASTSDTTSVLDHKKHKKIKQSTWRNAAYKTSKVVVDSPKQLVKEIKDDSQRIEGTNITNICCTEEKEALQIYENKGEKQNKEAILIIREKQVNVKANKYSTENEEQRASLCEVQNAEGGIKERKRKQNSSDEEQAQEEEALCSNTSVKESVLEEEDSVGETEEEEEEEGGGGGGEEEQQEEDGEKEDENKETSGRRKWYDIESDQEENYNDILASGSDRNIQESLRELYTEDDLTEKEGYIRDDDDEDDDDDDDDEDVIIDKASSWSCHPGHTKYQDDDDDDDDDNLMVEKAASLACHPEDTKNHDDDDDDDDDIEGLLAPHYNSLQHQSDEPGDILTSRGLHSNSEENAPDKDEPVDSTDEFDHFYD